MSNRREVETLLAVHRLMRRDAHRLAARLDSAVGESTETAALARWFDVYRNALSQHHEVEDRALFPALEQRREGFASVRAELAAQHTELDRILADLGGALADPGTGGGPEAARALADLLDEHIRVEEAELVPIANELDGADFEAVDAAASRMHPKGEAVMALAWMLDGFDEAERANFFAWQPRSVRAAALFAGPAYRRRARAADMGAERRVAALVFENSIGLPDELVPLVERSHVCEYASNRADGTPVTTALSPVPGLGGRTIDISTGLANPVKAERARRDPRVCLLFSAPEALPGDRPPVALVHGRATVRDADLQANTDRYVRVLRATSPSFAKLPGFVLRWMRGYLARIWIEITPERVTWWPDGRLDRPPQQWENDAATSAPSSDPPPAARRSPIPPLAPVDPDPATSVRVAATELGAPILTARDEQGYPVPFRAVRATPVDRMIRLDLLPHTPVRRDGPACLSFHTIEIKNDDMVPNENRTYAGTVRFRGDVAEFTVDRQLPTLNFRTGVRGNLAMIRLMRTLKGRLEAEAQRRRQPVPTINVS